MPPTYRELVKTAIKSTHDDLESEAATAATEKKTARASKAPADPVAKRERDAQLRERTDQAARSNLDLGHSLIHNLTNVDPANIEVRGSSPYGTADGRRRGLGVRGGS